MEKELILPQTVYFDVILVSFRSSSGENALQDCCSILTYICRAMWKKIYPYGHSMTRLTRFVLFCFIRTVLTIPWIISITLPLVPHQEQNAFERAKCINTDLYRACANSHPGYCSPSIHSIVSNDSVRGQQRSWSDSADAQVDLGLRCICPKTRLRMARPLLSIGRHVRHGILPYTMGNVTKTVSNKIKAQ